ncbi:MAG: GNAT family N-acetyltransferase [Bacteroidetes bacterium]|nr:GNAT family N-acetyltransferase [Bacteroidota bacterium]
MKDAIKQLLHEVDYEFNPNLSSRLVMDDYVEKIIFHSMIVPVYENGALNAFISFYCNDYKNLSAFLSMIVVKSHCRGKGLAKSLIEFAIGYLKNNGFKNLKLEVDKKNGKAITLYKEFGFIVINETGNSFLMERKITD